MQLNSLSGLKFEELEPREYRARDRHVPNERSVFSLESTFRGGEPKRSYALEPQLASVTRGAISIPSIPSQVKLLENILKLAYQNMDLEITSINSLQDGRKDEVKEVFYASEGAIYKVWVFKADPARTLRELKIYHIAHQAGVNTGKPIGFNPTPEDTEYPYDIAVLGGVLQHAGDSYQHLLQSLAYSPKHMHGAALGVAQMIADYHVKLTQARIMFDAYGIELEPFNVKAEVNSRLLAGLKVSADNVHVRALLNAIQKIDATAQGPKLISHNDIHERQIVTLSKVNKAGAIGYQHSMFGVVDWDSIGLDTSHGDLWDFWLHHRRLVGKVAYSEAEYNFGFDTIVSAYDAKFKEANTKFELPTGHKNSSDAKRAVWNLLEMYDPARKDATDIQAKAVRHARGLAAALKDLGTEEAQTVKKNLLAILDDKAVKLALESE